MIRMHSFILLLLAVLSMKAQDSLGCVLILEIDEVATFQNGGDNGFKIFFNSNVRYPMMEREKEINELIKISFNIDPLGGVSDLKILEAINENGFCKEALRILQLTHGMWNPSKKCGNPVPGKFILSMHFLSDSLSLKITEADIVHEILDVTDPAAYIYGEDSLMNKIDQSFLRPKSMGLTCGNWYIVVSFIVNKAGELEKPEVMSPTGIQELDNAAILAVMSTSGDWISAYKDGEQVRMRHRLLVKMLDF